MALKSELRKMLADLLAELFANKDGQENLKICKFNAETEKKMKDR